MRAMGILLVVMALTVGALAASTAYLVALDLPFEELGKLTLSADAGMQEWPREGKVPIARKGKHLTARNIAWLQEDGIHYVRVREFALGRWPGRWAFAAAAAGLLGGGVLLRGASRRALAAAEAAGAGEGPEAALRAMREAIASLRHDLAGAPPSRLDLEAIHQRLGEQGRGLLDSFLQAYRVLGDRLGPTGIAELHEAVRTPEGQVHVHAMRERLGPLEVAHLEIFVEAGAALAERVGAADFAELPNLLLLPRDVQDRARLILARLGEIQRSHMAAFVEARPLLVARLGLGGYAELMDRSAAA
jgi:hypothetical protein